MAWNLRDHGDMLEHVAADFVDTQLPAYSEIWASYIGHDGGGSPAALIDSKGEFILEASPLGLQRLKFSQYHYTILESLYSLHRLKISPDRPYLHDTDYINGDCYFLDVNDAIILFHAQLGRLRDALNKASECVRLIHDPADLDDLWNPRCIVLHGPRIPLIR